MSRCYRCSGEFPSEKVLAIHARHCDGSAPVAPRPSLPVRARPSGQMAATSRAPSGRIVERRLAAQPLLAPAIALDQEVLAGSALTMGMGVIIWACYVALAAAINSLFWFLLLLAGMAMTTGIMSVLTGKAPNDLAQSLVEGQAESGRAALIASGLTLVLSVSMYVSTNLVFGFTAL